MALNREELAWAAGFFDGEGNTRCKHQGSRQLRMSVVQVDVRPLVRLHKAVGVGNIYGPYDKRNPEWQPSYEWRVTNVDDVHRAAFALWNWLSEPKREQIEAAYAKWRSIGRVGRRPAFGEGHGMAKLTEDQVLAIRARRDAGGLLEPIAADFDISTSMVSLIGLRKAWTHLPD